MKNYRMIAAIAAGVLLMTQPVWAAGSTVMLNNAPVIVAGGGNAHTAEGTEGAGGPGGPAPSGEAAGVSSPAGTAAAQNPGVGQAPGGGQAVGNEQAPGMGQPSGGGQVPGNSQPADGGQNPPGDQGVLLSPVLTAGGGGQTAGEAPADAAAQQAAADAAAQQAAAQQVAAQQEAEAAAQQAAAQQGGGRHIDPSKPMVALTFDDGPQPSVGNRIMDCLAQYGGKATFFMVGDRVAARKTEVQRMVAEGHEVANHTMNHKYLQKLGAAEIQAQVTRCNDAIEAACGVRPRVMRLPGGNHNATVAANTHMPMIQWNIDTLDWKTKNAQKTVAAVLDHVKDGDIILMHELYSQSGDAALQIIPELTKRGYQLVTVSEMAAAKGHALQAGKLYSSFR